MQESARVVEDKAAAYGVNIQNLKADGKRSAEAAGSSGQLHRHCHSGIAARRVGKMGHRARYMGIFHKAAVTV